MEMLFLLPFLGLTELSNKFIHRESLVKPE